MVFHPDYFVLSTPKEFRGNNREGKFNTHLDQWWRKVVDNADE